VRRIATLLSLLAPLLLPVSAHAAVAPRIPAAPVVLPADIEGMPAYQPQTFCDPVAKPGVAAFGALLTATYPDTSVIDISRSCTSESGTSEHKDGRALDWAASVDNAQQVAEVHAVFAWLFAPDAQGNANAMLRRLGIMYIIWNKRIWGTWSGSWQPYSCSGVTACHQDHVHFSFDWAGAGRRTSFWTGVVAPPTPPPAYVYTNPAFAQVVRVAARREAVTTPFRVRAGLRYRFTVSGTYRYAAKAVAPEARADAECSTTDGQTWHSRAPGDVSAGSGLLDLWVGGHRAWAPSPSGVEGCNPTRHVYTRTLSFPTTATVRLSVADATRADDSGALTVTIQRV
jgi:hypothetical protein